MFSTQQSMKKACPLFVQLSILVAISLFKANAQNVNSASENGIYLSDSDFIHHHLVLGFDKHDEHNFKLTEAGGNQIKVKTEDSTYAFYFDAVWGYRQDNIDRRIFLHKTYDIKFIGKCCIYSRDEGPRMPTSYFFSVD